jgi:hypothetical protein
MKRFSSCTGVVSVVAGVLLMAGAVLYDRA